VAEVSLNHVARTQRSPTQTTKTADNPITFDRYLKYTIEHGHANHRADNYFSMAYWYQAGAYTDFPILPPAESRIPRLKAVPCPGTAQSA
jgi:hypothetical protein